jgi:hypothetical protein
VTGWQYSVDGGGWVGTGGTSASASGGYNQSHSIRVRAVDQTGQTGDIGGTTGAPWNASVSVGKGAYVYDAKNCWTSPCGYVVVDLHSLMPNTRYAITYQADGTGGNSGMNTNQQYLTTDGAGNAHVQGPKEYGYAGAHVWVDVDGLESNHFTWY